MRKLARRELGSRKAVKKCTISARKSMLRLEMFFKENNKIASQHFFVQD